MIPFVKNAPAAQSANLIDLNAINRQRFVDRLPSTLIAQLTPDSGTINGLFQSAGYSAAYCTDEMSGLSYFQRYPYAFPTFIGLCHAAKLSDETELANVLESYETLTIKLPERELTRAEIKECFRAHNFNSVGAYLDIILSTRPDLRHLETLLHFNEDPLDIFFDALCDAMIQEPEALQAVLNSIYASSLPQLTEAHQSTETLSPQPKKNFQGARFKYEGVLDGDTVHGDAFFGLADLRGATIKGSVSATYHAAIKPGTHIHDNVSAGQATLKLARVGGAVTIQDHLEADQVTIQGALASGSATLIGTTIGGEAKITYALHANNLTLGGQLLCGTAAVHTAVIGGNMRVEYTLNATALSVAGMLSSSAAALTDVKVTEPIHIQHDLEATRLEGKASLTCGNALVADSTLCGDVQAQYVLTARHSTFLQSVSAKRLTLDHVTVARDAQAAYDVAVNDSTIGGLLTFTAMDTTLTDSRIQAIHVGALGATALRLFQHDTTPQTQRIRLRNTQVAGDITFENDALEGVVELDATSTVGGTVIRGRLELVR